MCSTLRHVEIRQHTSALRFIRLGTIQSHIGECLIISDIGVFWFFYDTSMLIMSFRWITKGYLREKH